MVTVRTAAPPEVVRARLDRRAAGPAEAGESRADWSVYTRLRSREEPVRHTHIEVDSTGDIAAAVGAVLRAIGNPGGRDESSR